MSNDPKATPLEVAADNEQAKAEASGKLSDVEPVVIYTADTAEDGEIVRGILESEGIPVILTHAASPVLGQIFSAGEGQAGEILVAPQDVEKARNILAVSAASELPEE